MLEEKSYVSALSLACVSTVTVPGDQNSSLVIEVDYVFVLSSVYHWSYHGLVTDVVLLQACMRQLRQIGQDTAISAEHNKLLLKLKERMDHLELVLKNVL